MDIGAFMRRKTVQTERAANNDERTVAEGKSSTKALSGRVAETA